jgi:hypothetical protein
MGTGWFARSPLLLALGLIALALGFFIQWRGWWNGLFGLVGVALIAVWVYRASQPWGTWLRDRRRLSERRRQPIRVGVERRYLAERRAA